MSPKNLGIPKSSGSRRRAAVAARLVVEPLEERSLLSSFHALPMHHVGAERVHGLGPHHGFVLHGHPGGVSVRGDGDHEHEHDNGIVRKDPNFYEFYVGPRRPDLNVVAASARLVPGRGLVFRGIMQGEINKNPATPADDSFYVFGVNRGSSRAIAPFFMRPGVVFDSVVAISVTQEHGISGVVVDFTNGAVTPLDAGSIHISGKQVRVVVDPSALPTPPGGVALSGYTFNLWPRSSLSGAPLPDHGSFVASFIPEDAMAPIHVPGGHDG